jgi:prolyl-tRNA synthetase
LLEEKLVVRPTSETIIGYMYSKWIQSWRDLPILIVQWGSVMRWEIRTKLFLRTAEFYWHEGHTAHADADEALEEMYRILDIYEKFCLEEAAIPVFKGPKSESERFPGAQITTSIEAMMWDKRALQSGTSHYFGTNFAKAFDIQFLDKKNELQFAETTSWAISSRIIGAMIMVHGDDHGLVLPPRLAPIQAVVVPIFKNDDEKTKVMEVADRVFAELKAAGIRIKMDDRDNVSSGFKFNDWEMRGVPSAWRLVPRMWKRDPWRSPDVTSPAEKARPSSHKRVFLRPSTCFSVRYRIRSSSAPPSIATRTSTSQRITKTSNASSRTAGHSPTGASRWSVKPR